MAIELKIYLPDRIFLDTSADKVLLPVKEGNLTIIHERAPRSQLLTEGMVALLDKSNQIFKKWKISGGIATIAQDVCQIAVENIEEI